MFSNPAWPYSITIHHINHLFDTNADHTPVWKVADETQLVFRASSGTGDKKKQINLGVVSLLYLAMLSTTEAL